MSEKNIKIIKAKNLISLKNMRANVKLSKYKGSTKK